MFLGYGTVAEIEMDVVNAIYVNHTEIIVERLLWEGAVFTYGMTQLNSQPEKLE